MTDPRELLDAYASSISNEGDYTTIIVEEQAPKAFAALRKVLDDCDFLDACIANYKGYEIAPMIRNSITKALEATDG